MERDLLVIRATGRAGGHTHELLLQRGHRVRALVRGLSGRTEPLAALKAACVEGDVLHWLPHPATQRIEPPIIHPLQSAPA